MISAIGDYDGFRHADLTQYSPIHTPTMGTTWGLDYAAQNPAVVVRAGSAIYLSHDMALTWKKTASIKGVKGQVALSADGTVIVHCPEKSTTCYRSSDEGASWSEVQGLHTQRGRAVADPLNPRKFYALDGNRLLVSTDSGASFAPAAGMLASPNLPAASDTALRMASSAGEALPADIGERFKRHFGVDIVDGIGSTEMLHIFISADEAHARPGATGTVVPGYRACVMDDAGRPVPPARQSRSARIAARCRSSCCRRPAPRRPAQAPRRGSPIRLRPVHSTRKW